MQAVVFAGGLGTRLGSISAKTPKSLIPIAGKPFLWHQLTLFKKYGVNDVVLCLGHLGELIQKTFGDGADLGLSIKYSFDGPQLVGTGGALKRAAPLLQEAFFIQYGDVYPMINYLEVWDHFQKNQKPVLMVVYKNQNEIEASNVQVIDGQLGIYDESQHLPGLNYIDFGMSVIKKEMLKGIPDDQVYPLPHFFSRISRDRNMSVFITPQRPYEIGSPKGLQEVENYISSH